MTYEEQENLNAITERNRLETEAKDRRNAIITLAALGAQSLVLFWLGWLLGSM